MQWQTAFVDYLQSRQGSCLADAKKLETDNREDEAILEKVRANIYGIFATLAQRPNATKEYLLDMMEKVPAPWGVSLEKAIQHGDHDKEAQERVKLAAMAKIKAKFASIKGTDCDE